MPATPVQRVGGETLVNTFTGGNEQHPQVQLLAGGGYIVAWRSEAGYPYSLRAQLLDANGAKVGDEIIIDAEMRWFDFRVEALAGGGFAVVWGDDSSGGNFAPSEGIKLQLYSAAGTRVGDEIVVNTATAGEQRGAQIAELSNGNIVVTWNDGSLGVGGATGDSSLGAVKAQLFSAGGSRLGGEILVNTTTYHYQEAPLVTPLAGGGFLIAWNDSSQTTNGYGTDFHEMDVRAQAFDAVGAKVGGEFVVNATTAGKQALARLVPLDDGNLLAVWSDYSLGVDGPDTRAQLFSPSGARIGAEIVVAAGRTDQVPGPVEVVPGGFIIGWSDFDLSAGGLRKYSNDGALVAEVALPRLPIDIAQLQDGRFAVTYVTGTFGTLDTWLQLLDANLQKIGDPITVHTAVGGDQFGGDMAIGPDGRFLTVWRDQDTAETTGVKAQLFAPLAAATDGDDTITGTPGDDHLQGFGGSDTLFGLGGNDLLDGGTGNDGMDGGTGNDTFYVDSAGDVVIEAVGGGGDAVRTTVDYTLPSGAEIEVFQPLDHQSTIGLRLTGNEFGQVIDGNRGDNVLRGADGDDVIFGYFGNDILNGDAGADLLFGQEGDDTYYVDALDRIEESAFEGNDRVAASASFAIGDDDSVESLEAATLSSTERLDLTGSALSQTVAGNNGVNILRGQGGNDLLLGYGGDDFLVGGTGADQMIGGLGNDTFYVDQSSDSVVEASGEGTDRIATGVSYTLPAGASVEIFEVENSTSTFAIDLTGNAFDNIIAGNEGVNTLIGDDGNDVLGGYGGGDSLFGGLGNDVLIGGEGADQMSGGEGSDKYYVDDAGDSLVEPVAPGDDLVASSVSYTLGAGADVERLEPVTSGSTGALNFTGNEFGNHILGNEGQNILNGGGGPDVLEGLGGQDFFAFTTALGNGNIDRISDFLPGFDRIMLENDVFTGLTPGPLFASQFATGAQAQDVDDRIIYNPATGAILFDVDGAGGAAAVQFATVGTNLNIGASDFLVI